ncbi:MAG TPA: phosphate propanoyltransferase [Candidatus Rifleibacterium sp.]|nr:phosphate propanoyltransferase [Candidatus Rifleibacterium sp.]HPT46377.1 phosphate propanoyltransferase [Candidatus Rifleibacterium sp.]
MIDENQVKIIVAEVIKGIEQRERIQAGKVPTGVSNRHIHVSQTDLETLFGKGYKLKEMKPLSQPGQYAADETLLLVGPKGSIEKCRILGPVRPSTQVEISMTDSFKLGVAGVVRDSGDTKKTPGCTLKGPAGAVTLEEGVIVAARHIHASLADAAKFGLKDLDRVAVRSTGIKSVVFNNVLVRVSDKFALDFHIDTDEANAAGLKNGDMVEIVA